MGHGRCVAREGTTGTIPESMPSLAVRSFERRGGNTSRTPEHTDLATGLTMNSLVLDGGRTKGRSRAGPNSNSASRRFLPHCADQIGTKCPELVPVLGTTEGPPRIGLLAKRPQPGLTEAFVSPISIKSSTIKIGRPDRRATPSAGHPRCPEGSHCRRRSTSLCRQCGRLAVTGAGRMEEV